MKTFYRKISFLIIFVGFPFSLFAGGKEILNHPRAKHPTDPGVEIVSEFFEEKIKAEEGNLQAQTELAKAYQTGDGVQKDLVEAIKWYRQAAEGGDAQAQVGLGEMYFKGDGIEQDLKIAAQWYRRAAEQGHHHAQGLLGRMYMKGQGVEKDNLEAYMWFILSQGDMNFGTYMDSKLIVEGLSTNERAEAHRRAKAFVSQKEFYPPTRKP